MAHGAEREGEEGGGNMPAVDAKRWQRMVEMSDVRRGGRRQGSRQRTDGRAALRGMASAGVQQEVLSLPGGERLPAASGVLQQATPGELDRRQRGEPERLAAFFVDDGGVVCELDFGVEAAGEHQLVRGDQLRGDAHVVQAETRVCRAPPAQARYQVLGEGASRANRLRTPAVFRPITSAWADACGCGSRTIPCIASRARPAVMAARAKPACLTRTAPQVLSLGNGRVVARCALATLTTLLCPRFTVRLFSAGTVGWNGGPTIRTACFAQGSIVDRATRCNWLPAGAITFRAEHSSGAPAPAPAPGRSGRAIWRGETSRKLARTLVRHKMGQ